ATVTCSIRPETVQVAEGPPRPPASADHNTIQGRLIQTIYLGEMAQHHFELTDGSLFKVLQLSPGDVRQPGETASLSIAP
ncbi:MAG: TOBE domain-containing protein, partial [Gemmatimonadetes bacterium]|nr:TOBE domain-containing protein [Gemmatimonadota bacterium]NIW37042.1 TOBE domain-containing protein [Gemmatimonadota bacterium]NIX48151.1 TOBE domain-containing protein [Gemmatimonadota bacterium]NIY12543.1 TOBE domain-containing protein [Gemmatimonadota bacterium]